MIPDDGLPTPQRYYAMAVVILGIAMSVLDGTIVNLALPGIARDLQASAAHSIWVVNAYQIATLALLLPCAALGDIIGYRRVYLAGLLLFTLASVGCAFAGSLAMLAATRAIQGLGAAGIMSVNGALVRLIYPKDLLGRGIAINSMVVAASSVAGPSVAASILSVTTWPWLFAINLPLGAIVLALGRQSLPRSASRNAEAGGLSCGDVLLNAMMFVLVFLGADALGVNPGAAANTSSVATGTLLLGCGVAVGIIYLRRQQHRPLPVFPVDLLRIPVFALSMCTSVTAFTAQMLAYIALPFLFLDAYGLPPLEAGLLITAWPLTIVVVAPLVGHMIGRFDDGLLGGIGLGIFAAGLALLAGLPQQPGHADIIWRLIVCGTGFGLFQSPNNHTIVTSAPLHRSGGASGMLGTARLTGQTLGAVIVAIIFSVADAHNGQGPFIALCLAAAFSAIASVFSALRVRGSEKSAD